MKRFFRFLFQNSRIARKLSFKHWRYLFYSFSDRKKVTLAILFALVAGTSFFLAAYDYWVLREPSPAIGGSYTEGIIGEPRYLNPILSINNEVDRDIVSLIFAGLTKHNEKGDIVGDLAETIEIKEKGRVYEFTLRDNLLWPDNKPLTTDDVIFTINLIQNPEYQSPLRSTWQGVRVDKIDDRRLTLTLNLPYKPFLENTTIGILPKHFWENIKPQNFALAELNIKPIGAGPYKIKKIIKDSAGSIRSLELKRNTNYHTNVFVDKITFRFFQSEDNLISAFRRGDIDSLSLFSPKTKNQIKNKENDLNIIKMPRYFAVFLNEKNNDILGDIKIRQALSYLAPREKIIAEILEGEAVIQDGPLSPWFLPDNIDYSKFSFNKERAEEILSDAGWGDKNKDGIREKKDTLLEFTLTTTDWPELTQVASMLQASWLEAGFKVNLDIIPVNTIQQQTIRPREYEALLFGEVLGVDPDPFSFWHSSQVNDPGLNLSLYKNTKVDDLLESARQTINKEKQLDKFIELQQIITKDIPAIFLYSPSYLYILPEKIKGFATELVGTPSQRFENINNWYIKTKRTLK